MPILVLSVFTDNFSTRQGGENDSGIEPSPRQAAGNASAITVQIVFIVPESRPPRIILFLPSGLANVINLRKKRPNPV